MPGVPGIADDRLSLRGEKTRVPGLSDGPVIFLWSFVGLSMVFNGSDPQEWLVDVGLLKMEHTNLKWIMTWVALFQETTIFRALPSSTRARC